MITAERFIETHRDTARRADWLASIAEAAEVILDGNVIPSPDKRRILVVSMLGAIQYLARDLSAESMALSDRAEVEASTGKGGAA
jgi:hypothetical protein